MGNIENVKAVIRRNYRRYKSAQKCAASRRNAEAQEIFLYVSTLIDQVKFEEPEYDAQADWQLSLKRKKTEC